MRRAAWTAWAAISTFACGGGSENGDAPDAGGAAGTGGAVNSPDAGSGGTGTGGTSNVPPGLDDLTAEIPAVECPEGEYECRGACFQTVGEQMNGCELVAIAGEWPIEALALDDEALYVHSGVFSGELRRIDKTDFSSSVVSPDAFARGGLQVHDGTLYFNATHRPDDGGPASNALYRVPTTGGAIEFIYDTDPDDSTTARFTMIEGAIYLFGEGVPGAIRLTPGGMPESLLGTTEINSIAADATHFYYQRGFSDFDIARSPRSDLLVQEMVCCQSFGESVITGYLSLEPANADYVYFMDGSYSRVLKTGGDPELVVEKQFGIIGRALGPEYLLIGSPFGDEQGTFAVPRGGGDVLRIEAEAAPTTRLAEDATHFYLSPDGQAVFRIEKP